MNKFIPQSIKNIYHLVQAIVANIWYRFPSYKIKTIGVTGTNGKTTTCQMIAKILEESGARVAMASTINFKLAEKEWVNKTKFTTLSSFSTQKFIRDAVKNNCKYLVLEVSSHSLDQFRTWGIKFDTAVITNITREHFDYHQTMEKYRQAKLKLFKNIKNAVVNLDMEKPEEFLSCKAKLKFGFTTISNFQFPISNKTSIFNDQISKTKIIKAENIELGIDFSSYKLGAISYKLNLPGLFNIENALAAIEVGMAYKVSSQNLKKALESLKSVPGRIEKVPNDKGIEIIIDYAVTPDSLEKLYTLIKRIRTKEAKIISILGACGERDCGKRPLMGEIVSRFADYIILTNEDPYNEDPVQIINEIFSGIIKNPHPDFAPAQSTLSRKRERGLGGEGNKFIEGMNCWRILDRREAIKKALQIAKSGDIFVITGKGAEEIMAIGAQRIPWNEKKVILEELENLN